MKKINAYSAQYKIIQPRKNNPNHPNPPNPQNFARSFTPMSNSIPNKKKLSKDRQEFIDNISASGYKQFSSQCEAEKNGFFLYKWIY